MAVFLNGTDWQLKDWPKSEKTVDIFLKVRGYYLTFSDLPIPATVKGWNVKVMHLNRAHRHEDKPISNDLWKDLSEFLMKERYKGR